MKVLKTLHNTLPLNKMNLNKTEILNAYHWTKFCTTYNPNKSSEKQNNYYKPPLIIII